MDDRYPFIRFVIDAAQAIAGAVAVIVLLGGTLSACRNGGFGGLVSFVFTLGIAGFVYVAVMVRIESLQVLLDIEGTLRQRLAEQRQAETPVSPGPAA